MDQIENIRDDQFKKNVRRKSIRAFGWFFIFIALALIGWNWLLRQPEDGGALRPLRKVMEANSKIVESAVYSNKNLAPEYPKSSAASDVRVNGDVGMSDEYDTTEWNLQVVRNSGNSAIPPDTFSVTLEEIKKLPKTEVVFNFKCIEGWSQITWWAGVRYSDFAAAFKVGTKSGNAPDKNHPEDLFKYAGLYTPDREYYVGIDMASMLHPQTILCYELNGNPLPNEQGAPLRLIIPVKYGVKHIKRIGTLYFSDTPPPDYWAEQGYDYYSGL